MCRLIAKHACGVWCEMWVDFTCFRHKSSVMILAISMLYTQRWHEVLEGGGYNFERSMHYECFCAYVKSQMGIYIWFTMLLKVSFLHISWLGCLHETWSIYLEDTLKSKFYQKKISAIARGFDSSQFSIKKLESQINKQINK